MSILKPNFPFKANVELTTECNLKCSICPITHKSTVASCAPGHMKDTTWERAYKEALNLGEVLVIGMGEALMNPKCLYWMSELDSAGVKMSFSTNGILLTKQTSEELAQLKNLSHINISLDSLDNKIYKEIRGTGVAKVKNGIKNIMSVMDNPNRITVSAVLMGKNIDSVIKIPRFLSKHGIKKFQIQMLKTLDGYVPKDYSFKTKGLKKKLEKLKKTAKRFDINLTIDVPERLNYEADNLEQLNKKFFDFPTNNKNVTRMCCVPWEIPYIDKNGDVYPCSNTIVDKQYIMGNINNEELRLIWKNDAFVGFRKSLLTGNSLAEACQKCHIVPIGRHPYNYGAEIIKPLSKLKGSGTFKLIVKNIGSMVWTEDSLLRIGTIKTQDHNSDFYTKNWLSLNRICSFKEERVEPGQFATFEFSINENSLSLHDNFQLVFDNFFWVPNTDFTISHN